MSDGRITVLMANPDDTVARQIIVTALGTTCSVVWGDPAVIDALVAKVWPEGAHHPLRLLVCVQDSSPANEIEEYAQAIGNRLGAKINHFHAPAAIVAVLDALVEEVGRASYDLVVFRELKQPLFERLLLGWAERKAAERMPTSLLVARWPRWTLKKILLIIRGEEVDEVAVDWIIRVVRPSGAAVTVLAVVPPVPAKYHGLACMQQGLAPLLAGDSALGWQMRRVARQLASWTISTTPRLCQGSPDRLIDRQAVAGDYDLIVVAAERHRRWLR